MINTEHLIKKKAVAYHDAYNQDSDEELFMQMDMGNNGRVQRRPKGNNKYRRKPKRHHDPKFYAHDSDFESEDDDDEKGGGGGNNKNNKNGYSFNKKDPKLFLNQSFDKISIEPSQQNKNKKKTSGLSVLMDGWSGIPQQSRSHAKNGNKYQGRNHHYKNGHGHGHHHHGNGHHNGHNNHHRNGNNNKYDQPQANQSKYARYEPANELNNGGLFHTFILTVYFGEYINEEPIRLEITAPWTVNETINRCIQQWKMERAMSKLKGSSASHYSMRTMDIDEVSTEIDTDVPAFGKHLQIHTLNDKCVGLQFIGRGASNSVGYDSGPSSMDKQSSLGVMSFKNQNADILIRISIPGPNNESHVLAIDKEATALTVRDLISLLNKKKHSPHFHAQYFNFYYNTQQGKLKDVLNLSKGIIELEEPRQLILLPKFLTQNDDVNEAYNFNLVRLANERREYHCTKIRNARKNKKRLLIVDRHRIVKKAMDDYNIGTNDHVPIDIVSIIDLHIVDKNNKQFSIEYRKPSAGGTRVQVYELESAKECSEFVKKVKYLHTLRRLQGI